MKIIVIYFYVICLLFCNLFVISYGFYFDMFFIIVKMEIDEGIIGYGEGVVDDYVIGELWESIFYILKYMLIFVLIG